MAAVTSGSGLACPAAEQAMTAQQVAATRHALKTVDHTKTNDALERRENAAERSNRL